ncbi:MAG: LCP family protein [Dermatophilaceae bacterium]
MSEITRRQRAESRARRRVALVRRVLGILGVTALVAALGVGALWWQLEGNIDRLDLSSDLSEDRPERSAGPLNVLLIGSDSREGQDVGGTGTFAGARADTTLVAHVSADRTHVTVVSIPRDSMVSMAPGCDKDVPREEWTEQQFNSAFTRGGPACVINTVEGNTGLFIDHFAVVDFTGFRDMVDALGGVPVCISTPIDDPKAQLTLSAGRHVLDGTQALGWVRSRYSTKSGSDLERIERQQAFLSSVVQEATRSSLLARPDKLLGFLDAATASLTTDEEFGVGTMRDLGASLSKIGVDNVAFVTVPVEVHPENPNRVQWSQAAPELWQTLRSDQPITGPKPSATPSPSAEPLTVSPADIRVEVVNATAVTGLAASAAAGLQVQGFAEVTTSNAERQSTGAVVEYAPGEAEAARTVAAAFPGARVVEEDSLADAVRVTLGAGAPAVAEVPNRLGTDPLPEPEVAAPTPTATATAEPRTAATNICS